MTRQRSRKPRYHTNIQEGVIVRKFVPILIAAICLGTTAFAAKRDVSGVISNIIGTVQIKRDGSQAWTNSKIGEFIYEGDSVKTLVRSRALVTFTNGVESRLHANTVFSVVPRELGKGGNNAIKMSVGKLWNKVLRQKTKFDIHTPVATISVRGTEYEADVNENGETVCKCYDGEVEMGNEHGYVKIKKGTMSSAGQGEAPKDPVTMGDEDKSKWQDEIKTNSIKLTLKKQVALLNEEIEGSLAVSDSKGNTDKGYNKEIKLASDNQKCLFSKGDGKWQAAVSVTPDKGEASFKVKSSGYGMTSVSASGESLGSSMTSFEVKLPEKKSLRIKVKDAGGEVKEMLLKFKPK
jgi:ferric-dicitrate binding protein FerR (iron transport regulator)